MKAAERFFLVGIMLFSVIIIWKSQSLSVGSEFTIGPGFFPRYISYFLLITIGVIFFTTFQSGSKKTVFFTNGEAGLLVVKYFSALVIVVLAIPYAGMLLSMAALMMFSFFVLEKYSFFVSLTVSLITIVVVFVLFKIWLEVPLPGFLAAGG